MIKTNSMFDTKSWSKSSFFGLKKKLENKYFRKDKRF